MTLNQRFSDVLGTLGETEQQELFQVLRDRFPIHQLEQAWKIDAEFILEAIARSQDITQRGVRGIIAELCFNTYVVRPLLSRGWVDIPIAGDQPYDAVLAKQDVGQIKIQTKNQRLERGEAKIANSRMVQTYPHVSDWYICEVQKTRTGKDSEGNDTRPYRYGDFDILSVCLHPSSGDWSKFMFCPAHTLLPRSDNPALIATFQPVPRTPAGNWTANLEEAISWHLSGRTYSYDGPIESTLP